MRPVSLTVSGLQSFREAQTIPFSELCSGGVFGIFGPTGSGKSTILDAVTLALYGKVERAASGTHGILNQAEEKLSVSFTFQIGQGAAEKLYTVERSYKRSGEHTIRTSTSRLIEAIGEDTVVHADKERDVTRLVQELLGLTIEDFTRAVVLPQGKFAEFLSLKGADRRQMLQRLFQLEKYGDVLNQKLKRKSDEQRNRLNEINAEQAGLGDATSEALNEAAKILKENEQKLKSVSERLKHDEEKFTTLKSYWEVQTENETLLKTLKELNLQKPVMEQLKKRLKQAISADRVSPYAKEWQDSILTERKLSKEKDELQQLTQELKTAFEEFQKEFDAVKTKKNKQEPVLIDKRSGLKDAFEWEKELKEKRNYLKQEEEIQNQLLNAFNQSKKTEENAAQMLERGKDKQTKLKTELSSIEISQKERTMFQQALLLFQQFQNAETEEAKIQNELAQTEKSASVILQNKKDAQILLTNGMEKWKSLSNDVEQLYGEACEAERENEQLISLLQQELKAVKTAQEQNRIKYLAAQLSSQLKDNEPCAVCGSTVHPSPINDMEPIDDLQEKTDELESANESLKQMNHNLSHVRESLEKVSEKIWNKLGSANKEIAAAREFLTAGTAEVTSNIDHEKIGSLSVRVKGIMQDRLSIEDRFESALHQMDDLQKKLERISFENENSEKQLQKLKENLSGIQTKIEQFQIEWDETNIPFDRKQLKEKKQDFEKREERQAEIQKSLEVAVRFLEEQTAKIEKAKDEKGKLELELNTSSNKQKLLQKDIEILQEKLQKRVGDNSAQDLLLIVEEQLEDLLKHFKIAEENFEAARVKFLDRDKAYHSILQRFEDVQKRKIKSEKEWQVQLGKSMFSSFEEYESCLTEEEEQKKWENELTHYDDQCKAVQTSIDSLKNKLSSERLTEEQLTDAEAQLKAIKSETNEAREAVGQSRQNWLTIERNHIRYNELSSEKTKVSTLLEQIGKLQTVFRGNTFVEFMAEEQLIHVTRDASSRLSKLTRGRYAIEVDSNSGFVIRDDANGGIKRPVSSLSGGETFLTSLALALSLSAQIQLRGKYPLQFFFLDEGFGTLDQGLLDTVVTALEKVQMENFAIGVISHVPELKARLTKRLIVEPAEHSGKGTRVRLDQL
ncbi:AAA family ATPase [Fictibacillus barbaricus]|uniref:Nuclease SbcCD subunit C n=1 Tax=Fictibacillus barbaricus TaxID=182136 RepID=A0ABU1TXJ4_9BACL|nr:AAA family ATPase [Fictibacillus barbaricus]MDR7071942.1 exonuclease SbcC [Fictibacillus barbaricus]